MKTAHDLVAEAKAEIKELSLEESVLALKDADFVIDVREPDEFRAGHLPGAINIPRGLLEFKLSADAPLENREAKFIIYCKTSGRAALAASSMKSMGYQQVKSIAGGYDAWLAAGNETVAPELPGFE
ncbi:rhodanese-like domain-containing protein [Teredinibacter turnerae]|uniref:rhodanese-like domain-containing protein n=1 Tax=Teredinibacter turnerae TaxID=2426 RepID=UPI00035F952F|nr:rhodanese-like domain-containing protein [Teredinibacter turnerae]